MADKEGVMKTLQSNNSSLVFARGFAAPADPFGGAELEPPLKMYGTSAKYATALWAAATKAKVLDKVTKEIDEVLSLKNADAKFAGFLDDPTVPYEKKIEGLKKVFESGTFTDITKNFFFVLAENGRLEELSAVSEQYAKLVYASRGQVVVKVTSAIPLSTDQLAKCKDVLTKKVLQKGETLVMELNVDRKILGGLVFQIGEKHIDLSIEARIKKIENLLRDAADSI
jgi:F-type H+-transporting ATPase subunit O